MRYQKPGVGDPYYALKTLEAAVHKLAVSPEDLRSRIGEAYIIFSPVTVYDLPEHLQADFAWIRHELTKNAPKIMPVIRDGHVVTESTGSLGATVPYIRKETLVRIASKIWQLTDQLREHLSHKPHHKAPKRPNKPTQEGSRRASEPKRRRR